MCAAGYTLRMRFPLTVKSAAIVAGGALALRAAGRLLFQQRLDGGVVFVTGGSRGLGLAIAREFARRGARLAICGRDEQSLQRAAAQLREGGAEVVPIVCDLRDQGSVASAFETLDRSYGRLDVLVNNAGTIAVGPIEVMTREDYEDALGTHFWGAYHAVQAALPIMSRRRGGRIANITSIGARVSVPHLLPYCVSKFALAGYSEGLRAALGRQGISVTTVCPGLMRTGSPRNAWFKGQHRKEYAWFSISDALPGSSIAASTASKAIVEAVLRRDADITLSLPAQAISLLHGIAPGFTARIMEFASALLPGPGGIEEARARGFESETTLSESPLAALGKKAERDFNQIR